MLMLFHHHHYTWALPPQEELFGVEQAGEEVFEAGAAIFRFGDEINRRLQFSFARWSAEGGEVEFFDDLAIRFAGGQQSA